MKKHKIDRCFSIDFVVYFTNDLWYNKITLIFKKGGNKNMVHIFKKVMCILTLVCFCITCGCSQKDNSNDTLNKTSSKVEEKTNLSIEEKSATTTEKDSEKQSNSENNNKNDTEKEETDKSKSAQKSQANTDTKSEETDLTPEAAEQISEKICVDCIFSVGNACRPSNYLRECKLRFQAAPLDWMMGYSLDTAAYLFETKFADFFAEIEDMPGKYCDGCRFVKDTKNKVTSIHHFNKNVPLAEEQAKFRETMLNRANKVDEILKESSSIALICDRCNVTAQNLIDFLNRFSKIYPNKKITLINIFNSDIQGIKKEVLFETDNLKIIQFKFRDKSTSGKSVDSWKGNHAYWTAIVKSISLSEKFANLVNNQKVEF